MSTPQLSQAAKVTTGPQPQEKKKGTPPAYRLSRVVENNGAKAYEDVGAFWPHKDGNGFSIRLKKDLKASDNLMARTAQRRAS